MDIPLYKRLLSYFYPVLLATKGSKLNPVLELLLYHGYYQLATAEAVYSDCGFYPPFTKSYDKIKGLLPKVRNVLVLGTGLGSVVHMMDQKGLYPSYTLVDIDETVLDMALTTIPEHSKSNITTVCDDALHFMQLNEQRFDMLLLDVFVDTTVPGFVTSQSFLDNCSASIQSGGIFIFNYIFQDKNGFRQVDERIKASFPRSEMISYGLNRIYVACS